jgi:hypothetical protein
MGGIRFAATFSHAFTHANVSYHENARTLSPMRKLFKRPRINRGIERKKERIAKIY